MNSTINGVSGAIDTRGEKCPVSGLAVVTLPEFRDIILSGNHYTTLIKIGDSIVCIECRGDQSNYNNYALDLLNDRIEKFCSRTGVKKPYVQIYNKKAERGSHPLSILRREVAFFKDHQDTIKGLVFLQGKTWLTHFASFAMRLYKPTTTVVMVDTYAEAVLSAQHIVNTIYRNSSSTKIVYPTKTICFEDILFKPEWEYHNEHTGFIYQVGIVPQRVIVHSLHNDMSGMEDVRKSSELLQKCFKHKELLGKHQFSIVDLTNISGKTSLLIRISFAKEIQRLNKLYNLSHVTQIIITNNKFYQNAGKLFFHLVRQKAFIVETFDAAFALIGGDKSTTPENSVHSTETMVSAEDLDELNRACPKN